MARLSAAHACDATPRSAAASPPRRSFNGLARAVSDDNVVHDHHRNSGRACFAQTGPFASRPAPSNPNLRCCPVDPAQTQNRSRRARRNPGAGGRLLAASVVQRANAAEMPTSQDVHLLFPHSPDSSQALTHSDQQSMTGDHSVGALSRIHALCPGSDPGVEDALPKCLASLVEGIDAVRPGSCGWPHCACKVVNLALEQLLCLRGALGSELERVAWLPQLLCIFRSVFVSVADVPHKEAWEEKCAECNSDVAKVCSNSDAEAFAKGVRIRDNSIAQGERRGRAKPLEMADLQDELTQLCRDAAATVHALHEEQLSKDSDAADVECLREQIRLQNEALSQGSSRERALELEVINLKRERAHVLQVLQRLFEQPDATRSASDAELLCERLRLEEALARECGLRAIAGLDIAELQNANAQLFQALHERVQLQNEMLVHGECTKSMLNIQGLDFQVKQAQSTEELASVSLSRLEERIRELENELAERRLQESCVETRISDLLSLAHDALEEPIELTSPIFIDVF